jgi:hypothetical protein
VFVAGAAFVVCVCVLCVFKKKKKKRCPSASAGSLMSISMALASVSVIEIVDAPEFGTIRKAPSSVSKLKLGQSGEAGASDRLSQVLLHLLLLWVVKS